LFCILHFACFIPEWSSTIKALAITANSLRILLRSRTWLIFTLFAPLLFTFVLGVAAGGSAAVDPRLGVVIADADGGAVARAIVDAARQSSVISVEDVVDEADARQLVHERQTSAALILPAGLTSATTRGQAAQATFVADPSAPSSAAIQQEFAAILRRVSAAYDAARVATEQAARIEPFAGEAERQAFFAQALAGANARLAAPAVAIDVTAAHNRRAGATQIASGYNQSSAGAAVQWVMTGALSTAGFLALERQRGTLRRLLVLPVRRADILLGSGLLGFAVAVLQIAVVIVFGSLLGANWGRDIPALTAVVASYALSMAGLAMLFAALARSQGQAIGLGVALANVAAPLAGAWFPRELLPPVLLAIGKLFPSGWAMEALTGVIVRDWHLGDVLLPCAVMLAFAAAFLAAGARWFRFE
jgi:ABC-2 type transport system permease protein